MIDVLIAGLGGVTAMGCVYLLWYSPAIARYWWELAKPGFSGIIEHIGRAVFHLFRFAESGSRLMMMAGVKIMAYGQRLSLHGNFTSGGKKL